MRKKNPLAWLKHLFDPLEPIPEFSEPVKLQCPKKVFSWDSLQKRIDALPFLPEERALINWMIFEWRQGRNVEISAIQNVATRTNLPMHRVTELSETIAFELRKLTHA